VIGDQLTDEDLLASGEPEHFGWFYQRHVREVLGYMMRRTGDPEAAADLTAETFAAAIVARRRFRPGAAPAGAWLLTIAHRKLVDYHRRGFAEQRARRRLAMERRPLGEEDTALIRALGEEVTQDRGKQLPADQRAAIQARVLDERPYPEIASELDTSETAVRMRVSRGLASLRGRLGKAR
jgi:RNA polymerase sigma-70 factor (ECF subfamily)